MDECKNISDMLVDYINGKLNHKEINEVITHIAVCADCRLEAALLIKISNSEQRRMTEVPKEIFNNAFKKICEENSLDKILESDSPFMAFDLLRYTFTTVKQTIQLAAQA